MAALVVPPPTGPRPGMMPPAMPPPFVQMGALSEATGLPMGPQRPPSWIPPGAPLIPEKNSFPPQRRMDGAPEDGPVSVACNLQPEVMKTGQLYPCPDTKQYLHRGLARRQERELAQPGHSSDICGYVMATHSFDDNHGANTQDDEVMNIRHNSLRLVFQCISGWTLMQWRSQEEFQAGIYGARRAPRCIAWWDLRRAWDVQVEVGDPEVNLAPHRVVINFSSGNLYFLVELPELVPSWYFSIRSLIREHFVHQIKMRDTPQHQQKRWPAACGLARSLLHGEGIGSRALAITFHLYDLDYDCYLQVGEIMQLLHELSAGILFAENRAEGQDRDTAMFSSGTRLNEEDLFERAMRFRRACDMVGDGKVRKDDFVRFAGPHLSEAIDMPAFSGGFECQDFGVDNIFG